MYRAVFSAALSRMDAERAHRLGFGVLRAAAHVPGLVRVAAGPPVTSPDLAVEAFGLRFPNPLGVAAGFDKNAVGMDALATLGFGFVEVGTVTARAQPGNPRPRLFRLTEDRAVVNRMGFNNDGAMAVADRLAQWRARHGAAPRPIVGINIGRTRAIDPDKAIADYRESAELLAPHADYLVVNVSSPNTPGLRDLQAVERLAPLLDIVQRRANASAAREVPVLVKVAPDLSDADLVDVVGLATRTGLAGVIAVNTTIGRDGLRSAPAEIEAVGAGGLSGRPLRDRAEEVLQIIKEHADGLAVISVGGIETALDVRRRLDAGATLVQAYTGFIYGGPRWPRQVLRDLSGTGAHG